jgi:cytoskeletal protein RodZ
MPRKLLVLLIVTATAALLAPAAVLAKGPSAGDQQYTDPLAGSGHTTTQSQPTPTSTSTPPSTGTSAPASSPVPTATTSSTPSSSSSATSSTSGTTTGSTSSASGSTSGTPMPVTGYDLPLAILAGAGLLASGVCLRRATRKA